LELRVYVVGLRFSVYGLGLTVYGLGLKDQDLDFWASSS